MSIRNASLSLSSTLSGALAAYLRPGWQRQYRTKAMLTHLAQSNFDPNDPFWIVTTDQSMIRSHSDIEEPVFVDFIRQVYDDVVRLKEAVPCTPTPPAPAAPNNGPN